MVSTGVGSTGVNEEDRDLYEQNREQREDHARSLQKQEGVSDADRELYEQYRRRVEGSSPDPALHTGGLLAYPLWELIPRWAKELGRIGLSGSKDSGPVDVPPVGDYREAEASDGRKVWIRPGAYHDDDGDPMAEVRERSGRTDGAILAMLAVLEGGEGAELFDPEGERLHTCAREMAQHYHPEPLPDEERRKVIEEFAKRIAAVALATRKLQEFAERGQVGKTGDPARDVRAAELSRKNWSYPEIGRELGIPLTTTKDGDYQQVRKAVERGRKLLDQL